MVPNGAGKSTLLDVVAGLLPPDSGGELLDGVDLATVTPASRHTAIGMVSPDLPLLRGTIWRNLTYRCPRAEPDEVARVISLTGLDSILDQLPDGVRTRVGEDGAGLSSGQLQRLALARALLGGPRLLLLDEPDANLDPTTAKVVDQVVSRFPGTVLMVTHRPERLLAADVVWRLERGRLVEVGRPADGLPDRTPGSPATVGTATEAGLPQAACGVSLAPPPSDSLVAEGADARSGTAAPMPVQPARGGSREHEPEGAVQTSL